MTAGSWQILVAGCSVGNQRAEFRHAVAAGVAGKCYVMVERVAELQLCADFWLQVSPNLQECHDERCVAAGDCATELPAARWLERDLHRRADVHHRHEHGGSDAAFLSDRSAVIMVVSLSFVTKPDMFKLSHEK